MKRIKQLFNWIRETWVMWTEYELYPIGYDYTVWKKNSNLCMTSEHIFTLYLLKNKNRGECLYLPTKRAARKAIRQHIRQRYEK